jgi:tRNA modification GTPase
MIKESTICAISTPLGQGAIAMVRVSGAEALAVCHHIFTPANKAESILNQPHATVRFGTIVEATGAVVDEVLVSVFRAPHSFTGEDLVEISCHASQYIQQRILQLLLNNGCTMATAGEFTQRAFLNGKMDLLQAEAVADVIASTSAASHRLAVNQMRGGFSSELTALRTQLLDFTSLVELELDFSEEEVEFANRQQLKELAEKIERMISRLVDSFSVGNAIKTGIPVAIVGKTNVGKSTLLNVLLHEERAIVSDVHGTTRDVIEDTIVLGGLTFRFIDTAGIRQTRDKVESLGIERTFQKMQQASIVLLLIDSSEGIEEVTDFITQQLPYSEGKKLIVVYNKADLITADKKAELEAIALPPDVVPVFISAKQKREIELLQQLLLEAAQIPSINANDVIVTNARHYEALQKALIAIKRVGEGLQQNISGDFLSQDIRECLHYLGEITGQISTDEVLGNIFAKFCIGK